MPKTLFLMVVVVVWWNRWEDPTCCLLETCLPPAHFLLPYTPQPTCFQQNPDPNCQACPCPNRWVTVDPNLMPLGGYMPATCLQLPGGW